MAEADGMAVAAAVIADRAVEGVCGGCLCLRREKVKGNKESARK